MNRETAEIAARVTAFWRNVRVGRPDECWPWTGYEGKGYGLYFFEGRMVSAHELALTFSTGEIRLAGLDTCHSRGCTTTLCCNPTHLRFDTRQSNVDDTWAMGRGARPAARLIPEQVVLLRERRAAGASQQALAEQYGISESAVSVIVRGLQWKEVGGPIQTTRSQYVRTEASA